MKPKGIESLTELEREIVRMRCEEDLTVDEVAKRRGRARDTVKNISNQILRKTQRDTFNGVCLDFGRWQERQSAS
jgi:DNA-binding CsgD family transcriptional regulator